MVKHKFTLHLLALFYVKKALLIIWHIATANEAALTVKMSLLYSSAGISQMICSRIIFSTNFNKMYISHFRSSRFSELNFELILNNFE